MKKNITIPLMLMFLLMYPLTTFGQVWQGNGRIAISSDGNEHDQDDWAATALSLALLGAKGLQDELCLYTFSDHVWGSNSTGKAEMLISALEGADQFGFDRSRFLEAVANPEAAYNAMAAQINLSTASNPLIIIAAGPMQVVGEGLNRSQSSKRQYVTVISHSNWNDNHADNPGSGESHSGWTWNEMKTAFASDGVNFDHITDQNGGSGYDGLKAAISKFDWIKTSAARTNPAYKSGSWDWLYARQEKVIKGSDFDASDAGMVIYMLTGNEKTNPSDAQVIMENPVSGGSTSSSSTASSSSAVGSCDKAYVEIESVTARGSWNQETSISGYNGSAYFNWTGGDQMGTPSSANVLTYNVNLSKSDTYRLAFRGRRDQSGECSGAANDACNDIFVKIDGGSWNKTMVKGTWGEWIWQAKYEPGSSVINAEYNLSAGQHTIQISGRSKGVKLDAFSMYPASDAMVIAPVSGCSTTSSSSSVSSSSSSSSSSQSSQSNIIKAVDFTDYEINGMTPFYYDGTRKALAINSGSASNQYSWAGAKTTWTGTSGTYDITLTTLGETDGESPYRIKVNGVVVGEYTNQSTSTDYAPQLTTFYGIEINTGDEIQVESQAVTNGLVPEGTSTGFSRGRWQQIELSKSVTTALMNSPFALKKYVQISALNSNEIRLDVSESGRYQIRIYSIEGRILLNQNTALHAGSNTLAVQLPYRGVFLMRVLSKQLSVQKLFHF